jgi:hypothetical protein
MDDKDAEAWPAKDAISNFINSNVPVTWVVCSSFAEFIVRLCGMDQKAFGLLKSQRVVSFILKAMDVNGFRQGGQAQETALAGRSAGLPQHSVVRPG